MIKFKDYTYGQCLKTRRMDNIYGQILREGFKNEV
jgi:hypothetical protein